MEGSCIALIFFEAMHSEQGLCVQRSRTQLTVSDSYRREKGERAPQRERMDLKEKTDDDATRRIRERQEFKRTAPAEGSGEGEREGKRRVSIKEVQCRRRD